MDIPDDILIRLCKINPVSVPITMVGRATKLLDCDRTRDRLLKSLTRRRPRNDRERAILLYYATTKSIGGLLFIDALGGFNNLREC